MKTKLLVVLIASAGITAIMAVAAFVSGNDAGSDGDSSAQKPVVSAAMEDLSEPAQTALASEAVSPGGPASEGIKVHGHWVIEVRDPDGALATRREFDNFLLDNGILARLHSREKALDSGKSGCVGMAEIALSRA